MKVIDIEPQSWFFLTNGTDYFIDVNCNHSFVGFSLLIKLDKAETDVYQKKGKEFLNLLADDIQYYALSKYKERNIVVDELKDRTHKAILEFNCQKVR